MVNSSQGIPQSLSILIPVRNEGINLKLMLRVLRATIEVSHELLIIYDSEEDDSIPVVNKIMKEYPGLRLVRNIKGKGVPNALRSGFEAATGDIILILTADDLGPVLTVEPMLDLIHQGYDFVSATRYSMGGRAIGGVFMSRLLSRIANRLFYILCDTPLTDSTLGIKMFKRSILKQFTLTSKTGWSIAFELSLKAQISNLKIVELPIISVNRFFGGVSSFKLAPWVKEYTQWFYWGLGEFSKQKKLRIQQLFR
jgi:dolichol-phosphate mannosyltransferase